MINHALYFGVAELHAECSKAKRKKVGACLVTKTGVILAGYNGTPSGTDNTCEVDNITLDTVIHAELNCILKAAKEGVCIEGATLYLTLSPCIRCAAMIKQAGIKEIFYREQYRDLTGVQYLVDNSVSVTQLYKLED